MKLYKFVGEYIHPESGFGNAPIWHGRVEDITYASMDDVCLASFNSAQTEDWILGTAQDIAVAKNISPAVASLKSQISKKIRKKYTIDQEFAAHRLGDQVVLDDISSIVAEVKAQIDSMF